MPSPQSASCTRLPRDRDAAAPARRVDHDPRPAVVEALADRDACAGHGRRHVERRDVEARACRTRCGPRRRCRRSSTPETFDAVDARRGARPEMTRLRTVAPLGEPHRVAVEALGTRVGEPRRPLADLAACHRRAGADQPLAALELDPAVEGRGRLGRAQDDDAVTRMRRRLHLRRAGRTARRACRRRRRRPRRARTRYPFGRRGPRRPSPAARRRLSPRRASRRSAAIGWIGVGALLGQAGRELSHDSARAAPVFAARY